MITHQSLLRPGNSVTNNAWLARLAFCDAFSRALSRKFSLKLKADSAKAEEPFSRREIINPPTSKPRLPQSSNSARLAQH
jgi:hypothetical protein